MKQKLAPAQINQPAVANPDLTLPNGIVAPDMQPQDPAPQRRGKKPAGSAWHRPAPAKK